jgi:nitrite reductase (NADH) large subunit
MKMNPVMTAGADREKRRHPMMKRYVIIGNGVAGTTAAENIRKGDDQGKITIITDEDLPFYYRVRLNEFVSGDVAEQDLVAKGEEWYRERAIELRLHTRGTDVKPAAKTVLTDKNEELAYDVLLVATGSHSFIPPIKGAETKGVFALRNIMDARNISSAAREHNNVILIGGGLLGLETGNALRKLGKEIMVVEFFPRLLPRQLDVEGAKRLQRIMERMGFAFRLGAKTLEIRGGDRVEGVLLEGGETLHGEMVIISAGVRPNMELAGPLGLECDKGIKVNEELRTNQPDIFAAGDVAEFRGMPYGIWPAAMEQGKIAGANMAGGSEKYDGTTMASSLKVVGIDLASAGNIDVEGDFESRVVQDDKVYKKMVIEGNKVIGCIMLGDTKGFNRVTKAMAEGRDASTVSDLFSDK